MVVHVPQAGDQEFAGGVDNAGVGRRLHARAGSPINGQDASTADGDRDILARRRAGCVDDRGMLDDDLWYRALGQSGRPEGDESDEGDESEQSSEGQTILTCLFQISYSTSD
jgi:hypothetical protein